MTRRERGEREEARDERVERRQCEDGGLVVSRGTENGVDYLLR